MKKVRRMNNDGYEKNKTDLCIDMGYCRLETYGSMGFELECSWSFAWFFGVQPFIWGNWGC